MDFQKTVGKDITVGVFVASTCLIGVLYMINRAERLSNSFASVTRQSNSSVLLNTEISSF